MPTDYYNRQLALKLDDYGNISQIIACYFKDLEVSEGTLFVSLIDSNYHKDYLQHFSELLSLGMPDILQLKLINGSLVFVFMVKNNKEISLIAIEITQEAEQLFDEILKINNLQANSLRDLNKRIEANSDSKILLEEIMMLNSSLINTKRELSVKNKDLEVLNNKLETLNYTDYLTQIRNRRGFFKDIYELVKDSDLLLIMMDFNNFKLINDVYGHKRGDEALVYFAKAMMEKIRSFSGVLYRLGGDEFAILIKADSKINTDKVFNEIDRELKSYHEKVSMAYGSVIVTKETCNIEKPAEESMKIADSQMYEKKGKQKK